MRGNVPWHVCAPAGRASPPQKHTQSASCRSRADPLARGPSAPSTQAQFSPWPAGLQLWSEKLSICCCKALSSFLQSTRGPPSLPSGSLYAQNLFWGSHESSGDNCHIPSWWGQRGWGDASGTGASHTYFSLHRRRRQSRLSEGRQAAGALPDPGTPADHLLPGKSGRAGPAFTVVPGS